MTRLIILDRDGTINFDRDDFVKSVDEWEAMPGTLDAIARLNQAGWRVVVATNQSGIGRGLYGVTELNAMHAKMHWQLAQAGGRIESVFFCPHAPQDLCTCRKPKPGLFEQIGERYNVDLRDVQTVGDSLRDMQAGAAAGCKTHWVCTGKSAKLSPHDTPPDMPVGTLMHADLAALAEHLLHETLQNK